MGESQYYVLCSTCILTRFVVNQVGKIVNNEVGTYFLVRSPKLVLNASKKSKAQKTSEAVPNSPFKSAMPSFVSSYQPSRTPSDSPPHMPCESAMPSFVPSDHPSLDRRCHRSFYGTDRPFKMSRLSIRV